MAIDTLLTDITTHRSYSSDVTEYDANEASISEMLFGAALPKVNIEVVSCRSFEELALLQVKKPQHKKKFAITIFHPYQTYASHIYQAKRFETLTTFAKIYWTQDRSYFKNQTIIFTAHDLLSNAHAIFKFRRTFCKKILVPKHSHCGLEMMLREINELLESGDFNQSHQLNLEHTIEVNKFNYLE